MAISGCQVSNPFSAQVVFQEVRPAGVWIILVSNTVMDSWTCRYLAFSIILARMTLTLMEPTEPDEFRAMRLDS